VHDYAKMDMEKFKADMKIRIEGRGFTWFKFYPSLEVISHIPE